MLLWEVNLEHWWFSSVFFPLLSLLRDNKGLVLYEVAEKWLRFNSVLCSSLNLSGCVQDKWVVTQNHKP